MYQVRDVMNESVVTLSTTVTVGEAIRHLIENHISGIPIVDEEGSLVGIISEFQLLETLYSPNVKEMLVGDVMTQKVLTVSPEMALSEAVGLMIVHRIRRLPVIDNGRIVGIVSRRDLLQYTLDAGDKLDAFLNEFKGAACSSSTGA